MANKPTRGRPLKEESSKVNKPIMVRANPAMHEAIAKFQNANGFSTMSEALRQLLIRALKVEGLM